MSRYTTEAEQAAILSDYRAGTSTTDLALKHGRTRQNVIKLLKRIGAFESRPKKTAKLTLELINAIAQEYGAGANMDALASKYQISPSLVKKALVRKGEQPRPSAVSRMALGPEDLKRLKEMAEAGASQADISRVFGVSTPTVYRMFKLVGVQTLKERAAQEYTASEKRCATCGEWKSHGCFNAAPKARHGLSNYCKECERWRIREAKYGITRAQYEALHKAQGGCCAVCKQEWKGTDKHPDLVVDHDHETGAVRALLCPDCNNMLGLAADSQARLDAAKAYLASHSAGAPTATPAI